MTFYQGFDFSNIEKVAGGIAAIIGVLYTWFITYRNKKIDMLEQDIKNLQEENVRKQNVIDGYQKNFDQLISRNNELETMLTSCVVKKSNTEK